MWKVPVESSILHLLACKVLFISNEESNRKKETFKEMKDRSFYRFQAPMVLYGSSDI